MWEGNKKREGWKSYCSYISGITELQEGVIICAHENGCTQQSELSVKCYNLPISTTYSWEMELTISVYPAKNDLG